MQKIRQKYVKIAGKQNKYFISANFLNQKMEKQITKESYVSFFFSLKAIKADGTIIEFFLDNIFVLGPEIKIIRFGMKCKGMIIEFSKMS